MLRLALRVAETSEVSQKHGAVVVRGGSVLSIGYNSYTNDPKCFPENYLNDTRKNPKIFNPEAISVHAEVAAMKRCASESLRGATVYVARITQGGFIGNSAPCQACAQALLEAGVKKVVYTMDGEKL